ncbi:MAG: hypothetical protein JOZ63_12555, partial [Planctomycetaceae bacterium]|nr:hypothetical protein [Planctomycetaceae bacterium]
MMADSLFATADWFSTVLEDPEATRRWLAGLGVRDPERGFRNFRDLAERGRPRSLIPLFAAQLHSVLPRCPDPDMALTNLERFVAACPEPEATLRDLIGHPRTTEVLVQLFSTSQHFSELIIRDPPLLDWLRGGAQRRDREALIAELWAEAVDARDEASERMV